MTELIETDEERKILIDTMESVISELGYEIANTDSLDFREGLKARKEILAKILTRLKQSGE